MLSNKKLSIAADTIVNDVKICSFGAVLDLTTGEMNIFERRGDAEAIKENRDTVREDRAEFEDFAYSVQDDVKGLLGLSDSETVEAPAEDTAE